MASPGRSVVLVFDITTLANYPSHQIGSHGKAFVRKLKGHGIHIIPFVISARYTPEEATPFIHNFFSNISGVDDVKFAHNTNEEELYSEKTVNLLYRAYDENSAVMPPVYFFDRDLRHVDMMNMFISFHITANDSWDRVFEEITASENGSPTLFSFPPGKPLGVEPGTPLLGGGLRNKSRTRKTRRGKSRRHKGRAKK
jgi:hypothetical protein